MFGIRPQTDMTEAQLADIVDRWNARIDAGGYDMMGANVLMPQFETDDYRFDLGDPVALQ